MQTDSSFSRTYLTASNNCYRGLHQISSEPDEVTKRIARNEQLRRQTTHSIERRTPSLLRRVRLGLSHHSKSGIPVTNQLVEMEGPSEEDLLLLPPESSDEENTELKSKERKEPLPTPESTQPRQRKRPLAEANSNRRTSKRLKSEERMNSNKQPLIPSQSNNVSIEMPNFLSSSQLSQKKRQTYGKKLHLPSLTPESPRKDRLQKALAVPNSLCSSPATQKSKKDAGALELPPDAKSSPGPSNALFVPGEDSFVNNGDHDGDKVGDIHETRSRVRRDSASSLSSVDSISSIQLSKAVKARLNADTEELLEPDDVPAGFVRCPKCRKSTRRIGLSIEKSKSDISKMSGIVAQKFCFEHRMRDARQAWKDADYPEIDFTTLTTSTSFQRHLSNLLPIIHRKRSSYYLTKLDDAIAAAKGNQSKIHRYFQSEIISLTHNGYYGPRGAKLLSEAIATDDAILKAVRKASKIDKALRVANLARTIDSVLLPELLVALTQNDMLLPHTDEGELKARQILEDSDELGLLLNGDDDDDINAQDDDNN